MHLNCKVDVSDNVKRCGLLLIVRGEASQATERSERSSEKAIEKCLVLCYETVLRHRALTTVLRADVKFLSSQELVDYSVLLGITKSEQECMINQVYLCMQCAINLALALC